MRRFPLYGWLFFFLLTWLVLPFVQVQAQEESTVSTLPNFLGQDHSYTVTFRGNGEAVVLLRVILTNKTDEDMQNLELRVPRVDPKDVSVYQVVRQSYDCPESPPPASPIPLPAKPGKDVQIQSSEEVIRDGAPSFMPRYCQDYGQPDYYQPYWPGTTKYKKAKFELDTDTIKITFPETLKPNSSASFLLYYRAVGFAKKGPFQAYAYNFETLKVDDIIRNLQVGINTDSDLYLRGGSAKVDYRFDEGVAAMTSPKAAPEIVNRQIDSFYQAIGSGTIIKKASNLQPLDSYIVKGSYADSKIKLYGREIFLGVIIFLIFAVGLYYLVRAIWRFLPSRLSSGGTGSSLLVMTGVSFLASIFIVIYTITMLLLIQYIASQNINQGIIILLIPFSLLVYSLLLFAPAVFLGAKKGLTWGVGTLVVTVLFLAVYLFLTIVFFIFYSPRRVYLERGISIPMNSGINQDLK